MDIRDKKGLYNGILVLLWRKLVCILEDGYENCLFLLSILFGKDSFYLFRMENDFYLMI